MAGGVSHSKPFVEWKSEKNIENLQVTDEEKSIRSASRVYTAPEKKHVIQKNVFFQRLFFCFREGESFFLLHKSHLVQSFFQWFVFIDDLNLSGGTTEAGGAQKGW